MTSDALHPGLALVAFAEEFVSGRRVLVIGSAASGLAEHCLDRGARVVHVADGDPARLAEATAANRSKHLSHGPVGDGALALRDGAFDVALIENLAADRDPTALLRTVRRALAPRGVAVVASPNPDARVRLVNTSHEPRRSPLDYYQLYDTVGGVFDAVTMLGQAPFVGYAVAAFAPEGDVEPVLDAGLVPGGAEEPEWFVAVAGEREVDVEALTIVQLPLRNVLGPTEDARLVEQLEAARSAERRARERTAQLEAEITALHERARVAAASREHDDAIAALKRELDEQRTWAAELETRATTADARADEAEAQAAELRRQLDEAARVASRPAEAAQPAPPPPTPAPPPAADLEEVSRLEALLRDRGGEIRRLEREAVEAERFSRELLARLEAAEAAVPEASQPAAQQPALQDAVGAPRGTGSGEPPFGASPDEDLREKLDALAALNAEREADLEAARWRIAELEGRLAAGETPGLEGPAPGSLTGS